MWAPLKVPGGLTGGCGVGEAKAERGDGGVTSGWRASRAPQTTGTAPYQ